MLSPINQRKAAFILLYASAVGLLVAFSSYYDGLNADTAVAYLNSTVRWTPFMWGQDRYGMLIPALTAAITDPLANMIAQNALHVFTSVACFFLLARYLFPGERELEIGALALIAYIGLSGLPDVKEFLTPWQIYTPAMMFGLLALIVLPRSWWLALALGALAEWCNFAINILLAILLFAQLSEQFGREGWAKIRKPLRRQVLFLVFSSLIGVLIKLPYTSGPSKYGLLPYDEAVYGWIHLLQDYFADFSLTSPWLPLAPLIAGVLAFGFVLLQRYDLFAANRPALRACAVGLFTSVVYAMTVGASTFAKFNGFPRRYLIPSLMIWVVTWVGLVVCLLPAAKIRHVYRITASAALLLFVSWRFGTPSLNHVRESVDRRYSAVSSQIPESCTHLTGDYYRVWDSVFYSRLHGNKPLWAITYRSAVTQDLWSLEKFKDPRICYWRGNEPEAFKILNDFGLGQLRRSGEAAAMVELAPAPPPVAAK